MAALFMVRHTFITSVNGVEVEYRKGEIVADDDPVYRKSPELFGPLVVRGVEQATAAPGELRTLARGRSR